jgi:hypothetical protein
MKEELSCGLSVRVFSWRHIGLSAAHRSVGALLEGSLPLRLRLCAPSTASPFTEGIVLLCKLCVSAVSGGGVLATEA